MTDKKGRWLLAKRDLSPLERDFAMKCVSDLNAVCKRNFELMMTADMKNTDAFSIVISSLLTILVTVAKFLEVPEHLIKSGVTSAFKDPASNPGKE